VGGFLLDVPVVDYPNRFSFTSGNLSGRQYGHRTTNSEGVLQICFYAAFQLLVLIDCTARLDPNLKVVHVVIPSVNY
jgi:hypothetical protein